VYGVDVVNAGTDSARVATTALRGDGYHILVWTVNNADLSSAGAGTSGAPSRAPDVKPTTDPRCPLM